MFFFLFSLFLKRVTFFVILSSVAFSYTRRGNGKGDKAKGKKEKREVFEEEETFSFARAAVVALLTSPLSLSHLFLPNADSSPPSRIEKK